MKAGKIIGIIVGASLTIGVAGIMAACNIDSLTPKYSRAKINALNKLVNSSYLGDMEKDKIIDSIYLGYVSGLEDLDTTYLNEDGIKAQKALEKGQYVGTGIHFAWGLSGDNIIVTKIVENSPSANRQKPSFSLAQGQGTLGASIPSMSLNNSPIQRE